MTTQYLNAILDEWDKDCKIGSDNVHDVASEVSKLHAKYLRMHAKNNMKLKEKENMYDELRRMKRLHLEGKLTKKEMDDRGWVYDPLDGKKVMKSDMNMWVDTDPEVQAMKMVIAELTSAKELFREILGQINWRTNNLKVILESRKFEAGF